MQSRRNFLRSGVMTALSVGVAVGTGRMVFGQQKGSALTNSAGDFAIPSEARQETLFNYTQAAFESYLGSTFTATGANGSRIELTLVQVTGYTPNPLARITTVKAQETESFTLSFNASGTLPIFATIHTLHHDALGDIDLFLIERKAESGALFYEAVINHTDPPSLKRRGPVYRKDESPRMPAPDSESPE